MQTVVNIDTVRIELNSKQRIYYFPIKNSRRGMFRLYVSTFAVTRNGTAAFPCDGREVVVNGNSVPTTAFVTLAATDGSMIAEDFALSLCTTNFPSPSPLLVTQEVDWDNSFITIPDIVPADALENRAVFVNLIYYEESDYRQADKYLVVNIPRNEDEEQRLSDFIVGYQGKLVRIEVATPTYHKNARTGISFGFGQAYLPEDGYITLNDNSGRTFENVPLDLFFYQDFATNQPLDDMGLLPEELEYMECTPRVYNPIRFMPFAPVWQNCKIYTGSTKPQTATGYPDFLTLILIFA